MSPGRVPHGAVSSERRSELPILIMGGPFLTGQVVLGSEVAVGCALRRLDVGFASSVVVRGALEAGPRLGRLR